MAVATAKKAAAAKAEEEPLVAPKDAVRVCQAGDHHDYQGAKAIRDGDYLQIYIKGDLYAEFAPGHWSAWQYVGLGGA